MTVTKAQAKRRHDRAVTRLDTAVGFAYEANAALDAGATAEQVVERIQARHDEIKRQEAEAAATRRAAYAAARATA